MKDTKQSRLERIFAMILASLSKVLIKNNVPLSTSIEILKRSLVGAALDNGEQTDSAISLKTGVHRKDVKRLRIAIQDGAVETYPIRGLAVVLSVWANNPSFTDEAGQPRVLHRHASPGVLGFNDLVRVSKVDLAAATVLQELIAQSLVRVHEDGGIELLSTTFVGQTKEAALQAFEATVADHVRIAADNVLAPPGAPRHFDQVLRYSHLSAASVAALEAEAREMAQQYLERMNALAHRLQSDDDASGTTASGRFVAGTFIAPVYPDTDTETDTNAARAKEGETD